MWTFIQNQILGMQWLSSIVGAILNACGVDTDGTIGGSLHFFMYDILKITLLLCVLIFVISIIQSYFPPERCRQILGRRSGFGANIMAALLGTVTPFCSCSSIPIFMGFTRAGLPLGVTFSFLISSPMVDLGSLVILTSIFGIKLTLGYVILGLIIAVAGGSIIERLDLNGQVADFIVRNQSAAAMYEGDSMNMRDRVFYAIDQTRATFRKVFPYIVAGVAVGAIIHNWIPESLVSSMLGQSSHLGVLAATLIGIPIYADIFGTIPIAEALIEKGAQVGTVLSFMMAVTTLSLPSLLMLSKVIKPKLLWIFIAICTSGIVFVGYAVNLAQHIL